MTTSMGTSKWRGVDPTRAPIIQGLIRKYFEADEDMSDFESFNGRERKQIDGRNIKGIVVVRAKDMSRGYAFTGCGVLSSDFYIEQQRAILMPILPNIPICAKTNEELRTGYIKHSVEKAAVFLNAANVHDVTITAKVCDYDTGIGAIEWRRQNG